MRKVQVTIDVIMVADEAADGEYEHLNVYADANNVFEAVASANQELMDALEENRDMLSPGRKMHYWCGKQGDAFGKGGRSSKEPLSEDTEQLRQGVNTNDN